ncbi:MAG: hypothetical protein IKK43_03735 [Clostridia bacterium]|nr:hypothetical protein [Clostridia bacterium]
MSRKSIFTNVLIAFLILAIVVLLAIIGFNNITSKNNLPPAVNVTKTPQNVDITQPTNRPEIPTAKPTATTTPWIPVIVTNTPQSVATTTPELWYIVTVTPNNIPAVTATPFVTSTPTVAPTPIVTVPPTKAPTPVPTAVVTEEPPKYTKEALEAARQELYKLTAGVNEILPDYNASKKYDLYNYITIDKVEPNELFLILKDIYINTMAHSLDFRFEYENTIQGLEMTLNSAYCPNCGKVQCVYKRENDAMMKRLLESVRSEDVMNANMLMLNFLCTNSYISNDNINERLIICCPCNK